MGVDLLAVPHDQAARAALSVVVPCYNEALGIDELHRRTTAACLATSGPDYELVLVDDGSSDATWQHIARLARHDPAVVGVRLSRNHGHQQALSAGLALCRGARVLVLDADLQDPPELLGAMMALMDEGAEIVYGQRRQRLGETRFKKLTAALFYRLLARLVDVKIPVDTGDFRLMSRRAVDILNTMPEQQRFIRGMVSWIGLRQVALPYDRQERFAGSTKYPFAKMLRFAVDAVTSFSIKPLRLASYLGVVFGSGALLALGYTLWAWVNNDTVQGWTSVMTVVLVLGSAQMFLMGLFGEYLGRLYMESKRRPLFIVDQVIRSSSATAGDRSPGEPARADVDRSGAGEVETSASGLLVA